MTDPKTISQRIQIAKAAPDRRDRQKARLALVEDAELLLGQLFVVSQEFTRLQATMRDAATIIGALVESAPEQTLRIPQVQLATVNLARDLTWEDQDGTLVVRFREESDDLASGATDPDESRDRGGDGSEGEGPPVDQPGEAGGV